MDLLHVLSYMRFTSYNPQNNDFFIDRLSHRHTNGLVLVFIGLASYKRLASSPINCWIPAELRRYEKYMNRYCWLKGTYYVKDDHRIETMDFDERNDSLLRYYQWIPIILLLQAFLFYLPRIIWSFTTEKILGYNLFDIIQASIKCDAYDSNRKRTLKYLIGLLTQNFSQLPVERKKENEQIRDMIFDYKHHEKHLKLHNTLSKNGSNFSLYRFLHSIRSSSLLLSYYLTKNLYFFIALFQLYFMNYYLSNKKYSFYGNQVIHSMYGSESANSTYIDSRVFPRITSCDVTMRELGTLHHYTIQCVLSLNLFHEIIYVFLWFWVLLILLPFTIYDLLKWSFIIFYHREEYLYKFIKRRIKVYEKVDTKFDKYLLKLFAKNFIGFDGVFILKLIERNSNPTIVSEVIIDLWRNFKRDSY